MFIFNRGINEEFARKLNAEYERGGWWRSIVSDPDLFIAIREDYLNVYLNGNSLLRLRYDGENLVGQTHYKFLFQYDASTSYVPIVNGRAEIPVNSALSLRDLTDLPALKRAAAEYGGYEKAGVHRIVLSNTNIIDIEVAFSLNADDEINSSANRIDFVALRTVGEVPELVFYEAKLFNNPEIRAKGAALPPVLDQIADYGHLLAKHPIDLIRSYRRVCGNLASLLGVRDRYLTMLDMMQKLDDKKVPIAPLNLNEAVRLVVFGYDSDQDQGKIWKPHRAKLENSLVGRAFFRGDPAGFKRGISTPT